MAQLISTKLRPPPLRIERVNRPHIYEGLSRFNTGVVLVSAPPGFGKSTLIVEWLRTAGRPFAWYSLDQYDGDVGLFCEYLGEAIARLKDDPIGLRSLPEDLTPAAREVIAGLVSDLSRAASGSVLVLDDYHEVQSEEVHEIVNYLAENLPDGITLAISTRADPPLPFARLRASGRLHEIRADDLSFAPAEVQEFFLNTASLPLRPDQIDEITRRSEGWVSALHLVLLSRGNGPEFDPVEALRGQHSHIAGYLFDEVLEQMEPDLARFLLETSTFSRFDAALCEQVLGHQEAASIIDNLYGNNAFLIPLGAEDDWYRYHHLFTDLLRSHFKRTDAERQQEILISAAHACDLRNLPDDAIGYALRAGDVALAAAIADRHAAAALSSGQISRIRSWLMQFPQPAGEAAHVVDLGWAWCRIFEGNLEAATHLLDLVETNHLDSFDTDLKPQLAIMRAMAAFQAGDPETAERLALRGLEDLRLPSPYLECLAQLYIGRSLHARALREEARPHLERSAALAGQGNTLAAVNALFWLGVIDGDIGNLIASERTMSRAQELAAGSVDSSGRPNPAAGFADIGMAFMRLNQLEPDEAAKLAERGSQILERSTSVDMMFRAFFVWAEALSLAGRFDSADSVARDGVRWLTGRHMGGGPLESWMWLSQTRNLWRQGKLVESEPVLNRILKQGLGGSNDDETLGFYEAAAQLSYAIRTANAENARELMAKLPPGAEGNAMFAIERQVLQAATHELNGDRKTAAESLESAVGLAAQGYRYQFSHVGPIVRPILGRLMGRSEHDEFIASIIDRLPEQEVSARGDLVDPLTTRELDVLSEISAGFTNEEIADRLYISKGTVKRHVSNIYMKLGVHHRAEAIARSRELHLLH